MASESKVGQGTLRKHINVEVCLRSHVKKPDYSEIADFVKKAIVDKTIPVENGVYRGGLPKAVEKDIQDLIISGYTPSTTVEDVGFETGDIKVFTYALCEDGVFEEMTEGDEAFPACSEWVLPAVEFHKMWESIIVETKIKERLLSFARTAMLFTDMKVDASLVSWNRVVLLHGPPGTGKTSLCKSLSQKLSIVLKDRYPNAQLLEINAHSLFSKWFSESGKLVTKLFSHIRELVEDTDTMVCVLIDEVESLAAARKSAVSGSEPSDAVRAVNAFLTQLDSLRLAPNVLTLTTSNISEAIDLAFIDRADIKAYVGLPGEEARYGIIRSCLLELMRAGVIVTKGGTVPEFLRECDDEGLKTLARETEGVSGRGLRKLPVQAHALYVEGDTCTLPEFVAALRMACASEKEERGRLSTL